MCVAVLIGACQRPGDGQESRFYSYVDAQGNLVTVRRDQPEPAPEREPEGAVSENVSADTQALDQVPEESLAGALIDPEDYQSAEALEARMASEDNQRFVTYPGQDGQLVTENLDKREMTEAQDERYPGYQDVIPPNGYIETSLAIPAQCCVDGLEQAPVLKQGRESRVAFSAELRAQARHPAAFFALDDGVGALRVATFLEAAGLQYPQLLFLNESGVPVLHVSNIFQRKYDETWYRFAYYSGEIEVPESARYAVLYLNYVHVSDEGGITVVSPPLLPAEAQVPGADGVVVLRGLPAAPGN